MIHASGFLYIGGAAYFVWAYAPNCRRPAQGTYTFIIVWRDHYRLRFLPISKSSWVRGRKFLDRSSIGRLRL